MRKTLKSGQLGFAAAMPGRHMDPQIRPKRRPKDPLSMPNALKLGLAPLTAPQGRVRCVLRRGPEIRSSDTQGSRRGDGYRGTRREVRTVYREKKLDSGSCYAGRAEGGPIGRDWVGKVAELTPKDFLRLGGLAIGRLPNSTADVSIFAELPGGAMRAEQAADLAQGSACAHTHSIATRPSARMMKSRPLFGMYRRVGDIAAVRKADAPRVAISDGVVLARDLVNEPANVLYPEEFARRAGALKKLRVAVEVLDVKAMKKLGMNALLGVGQGSTRESRVVVMRWNGGKAGRLRLRSSAKASASTPAVFRSSPLPIRRT